MTSLISLFEERAGRSPNNLAVCYRGDRGWETLTWTLWWDRAERVAAALIGWGLNPGDRVLLAARTRVEWVICDLGIMMAGGVTVPLFPSLLESTVHEIVEDAAPRAAFIEDFEQWEKIKDLRWDLGVVVFEPENLELFSKPGLTHLGEFEAIGQRTVSASPDQVSERRRSLTEDSLASIVYTSGTSRSPVGVPLTHGSFVHEVVSISKLGIVDSSDVQLLFLPLAHIFARVLYLSALGTGMQTVLESEPAKLVATCAEMRPTFFAGVPHIFEILRRAIEEEVRRSPVKGHVLTRIGKSPGGILGRTLSETLLKVIRSRFGGRLRFAISGGAPFPIGTAEYFEGLGIPILEGYGLTETCGVATVNALDERRLGSVGRPLPGVQVAIEEDGEILVRGPSTMTGYWGAGQERASPLQDDGWLHTGDLGEYDRDGFLFVTGRKKDILVTSGGKNIAPAWIEALLNQQPFIAHAVLVGDGLPFVGVLIELDWEAIQRELNDGEHVREERRPLWVGRREVQDRISDGIRQVNAQLSPHERIKKFVVLPSELDPQRDLTPTFKLRRDAIVERHRGLVQSMYTHEPRKSKTGQDLEI